MQKTSTDLREYSRHYIPASDSDIQEMLRAVGKKSLEELFDHIPTEVKFEETVPLP